MGGREDNLFEVYEKSHIDFDVALVALQPF